MSTRAVRIAINLQNLDPCIAHSKCDKNGQLMNGKVVSAPAQKIEEVAKETRSALVEIKPTEPVVEQSVSTEEIVKDETQIVDMKTKKVPFKKKVPNTIL